MARHVAYKCPHCKKWAKVRYTEDMDGSTKAVCQCTNDECQAEFSMLVTHLENLRPPLPQRQLPIGTQLSFL
jgi:hypothetical protein